MKIEEQTRVEIQQALGYAPPSPSDPGFAAFYSRLETEHPQLASQLLAGLQHEEGEGNTDSQAFFPEQEAQARTRAQARNVLQRLFYRQDHLTDEWTVSKGKVGMAGLFGACLLLGPMLLAGAGNSGNTPTQATQRTQTPPPVAQTAPPPAVAPVTAPPPMDPPLADVPAAPPPADLPPVADAPLPDAPVPDAPLPEVTAPTVVEAPPMPVDLPRSDPAPLPVPIAPPPAGATIYKAAKTNASTSSTVYLAASRTGGDKANGAASKDGAGSDMTLFNEPDDVNPGVPITLFSDEPTPEAAKSDSARSGADAKQAAAPPVKTSADYLLGTSLKAELSTGLIATQGRGAMPVLAKSESGEIFSGLAVLSGAGRVEISFTSVLIKGQLKTVNARAYDPSGLPGLTVKTRDVAPSLAADLSRAAASGVAGYVEQLGDQTQTVTEGKTTTVTTQPPKLSNIIAGAIARLFSTPPTQKALERIAQVDRGTPLLITVMGEGAEPAKKPESAASPPETTETP